MVDLKAAPLLQRKEKTLKATKTQLCLLRSRLREVNARLDRAINLQLNSSRYSLLLQAQVIDGTITRLHQCSQILRQDITELRYKQLEEQLAIELEDLIMD